MKVAVVLLACVAAVLSDDNEGSRSGGQDPAHLNLERYTTDLHTITTASDLVKKRLYVEDAYHTNDVDVQYLMILNAINSLIDVSENVFVYRSSYYETVNNAILETSAAPLKVADKLAAQLAKTTSKLSAITDLIREKQSTTCEEPISYTCDLIVDIAVHTSRDRLVKIQANHIGTVANEARSYLTNYMSEFDSVARKRDAPAYLVNGIDRLEPIVMLGVSTRQEGKPIPPIGTRRHITTFFD